MRFPGYPGLASLLIAIAGPAVCQPDLGASASGDLHFGSARLGMSLAQWKASALPGPPAAGLQTTCSNEAEPAVPVGVKISASRSEAGALVCSYVTRLGPNVLPQYFPLTKTYLARSPTFTFVSGKLYKIEFRSSIDAFDDLVAIFEGKFGPAGETIRDQVRTSYGQPLPRVQKIWRLSGGLVRITDPSARPDQLVVDFTPLEASPPARAEPG
jgi:hypothetical protein